MIRGLILSFQFFSRIPINKPIEFQEKNIRYSVFFMPLVGALIGLAGGVINHIFYPYNELMASFLTLLTVIALTGGLHLDGLSDTIDGFMSGRDRERTLEIMKDSRIGAFAAMGLVLSILFKFILIYSISDILLPLILSLANSRLVVSRLIAFKKNAKQEGLGDLFHRSKPGKLVNAASLIYVFILVLVNFKYLIPLAASFFLGEYISHVSYKKIGGLTGDVSGATIELTELVSLLGFFLIEQLF
ncbi:MAG: adenosylcobinamide-GDP ribazoletransferase [Tissierellaceae bacterium]